MRASRTRPPARCHRHGRGGLSTRRRPRHCGARCRVCQGHGSWRTPPASSPHRRGLKSSPASPATSAPPATTFCPPPLEKESLASTAASAPPATTSRLPPREKEARRPKWSCTTASSATSSRSPRSPAAACSPSEAPSATSPTSAPTAGSSPGRVPALRCPGPKAASGALAALPGPSRPQVSARRRRLPTRPRIGAPCASCPRHLLPGLRVPPASCPRPALRATAPAASHPRSASRHPSGLRPGRSCWAIPVSVPRPRRRRRRPGPRRRRALPAPARRMGQRRCRQRGRPLRSAKPRRPPGSLGPRRQIRGGLVFWHAPEFGRSLKCVGRPGGSLEVRA
mmetsp:Transcript_8369/g.22701  ORF Transcript_8369/g.22701 Transcript_8369/m.22701 type:complete len:339 (-) Transcript_8369:83-1099(-)